MQFSLQVAVQKVWEDSGCQIWLALAAFSSKAANRIAPYDEDLDPAAEV